MDLRLYKIDKDGTFHWRGKAIGRVTDLYVGRTRVSWEFEPSGLVGRRIRRVRRNELIKQLERELTNSRQ